MESFIKDLKRRGKLKQKSEEEMISNYIIAPSIRTHYLVEMIIMIRKVHFQSQRTYRRKQIQLDSVSCLVVYIYILLLLLLYL